jgi:hypothetical protein
MVSSGCFKSDPLARAPSLPSLKGGGMCFAEFDGKQKNRLSPVFVVIPIQVPFVNREGLAWGLKTGDPVLRRETTRHSSPAPRDRRATKRSNWRCVRPAEGLGFVREEIAAVSAFGGALAREVPEWTWHRCNRCTQDLEAKRAACISVYWPAPLGARSMGLACFGTSIPCWAIDKKKARKKAPKGLG